MVAFLFPNSPAVNDVANGYVWDGEKWSNPGSGGGVIYIADSPPSPVPVGSLWWESDTGLTYLRYNDGDSTQWVCIADSGAGAVRFDYAQALAGAQQEQARTNIAAAPFDAMAYSGMQINGSMEVSQELGTAGSGVTNATTHIVDGWAVSSVGGQTLSCVQTNVTPSPPLGYVNLLRASVPTANAAPAAGHYAIFLHRIEGYRVARLAWGTANAQPITIGFWVHASRTGLYSGSVANNLSNRSYVFTFTINAVSAWEFKTITIPGDTTGTWEKYNIVGMRINLAMMAGSTFRTAAGVWTSGNFFGATDMVNGVAATSDVMSVTGLVVLPGVEAPPAARAPFIMRPYDQELMLCKRYYSKRVCDMMGYSSTGGTVGAWFSFPVPMRVAPTVLVNGGSVVNVGAASVDRPNIDGCRVWYTVPGTGSSYYDQFNLIADARL
jgi:hypothetical protein